MTWTYKQTTGQLFYPNGSLAGTGYSGHGVGVNNPEMESDAGVGPIPAGKWTIGAALNPPDHLGPLAMPLTPEPGTNAHGRSAFFMHGDFAGDQARQVSHGCIVIGPIVRSQVHTSDDHELFVVA